MVQKTQALERTSPEAVRIVVVNYVAACLLRTEGEKEAVRLLNILQAFSSPFNPSEKQAPLLLALGSIIFP